MNYVANERAAHYYPVTPIFDRAPKVLGPHLLEITPFAEPWGLYQNPDAGARIRSEIAACCQDRGIHFYFLQGQFGGTGVLPSLLMRSLAPLLKASLGTMRRYRRFSDLRYAAQTGHGYRFITTLRLRDSYTAEGKQYIAAQLMDLVAAVERRLSGIYGEEFAVTASITVLDDNSREERIGCTSEPEAFRNTSFRKLLQLSKKLPPGTHMQVRKSWLFNKPVLRKSPRRRRERPEDWYFQTKPISEQPTRY